MLEPVVGELYQILHHAHLSRSVLDKSDIVLVVDIESVDTAPAQWKRKVSLLTNGKIVTVPFTDFKSMLRYGEMAKVE